MSEIPTSDNSAFEDALLRAKQIASKIKPNEGSNVSLKRPLSELPEGPDSKKFQIESAPIPTMMQAGDMSEPGMGSSEVITVPNKMVGLIIGRGGEQISRLQSETGCKIQMAPDTAGPERQCTIAGSPQAIANAKAAIDRIIANEGSGPQRGPPGGMGGTGFFEMMVPGDKVGLIIGKGGETIRHLQESTGAKIVIIQESAEYDAEKPLRITGPPDAVERAKSMAHEILNQNDQRDMGFAAGRGRGRGRGMPMRGAFMGRGGGRGGGFGGERGPGQWGGAGGEFGGQQQDYISVPANKCGLVIGKGGETIKQINQATGATCMIDKNAPPDADEKNFIIRGPPDAVERAKAMILEKIGMNPGDAGFGSGPRPGGAGGYGGAPYGSTQYPGAPGYQADAGVVAQPGQPDYSQQWIEYYRSLGMTREAEAIEQQVRASRGPAMPPAQPVAQPAATNGAANGTPDYSAQWADYYRSIGKVKEAEAIEAQMKQKAASAPQAYAAPGAQFPGAGYYGGAQPQAAPPYAGYTGYTG